jgi:hypothetical protein
MVLGKLSALRWGGYMADDKKHLAATVLMGYCLGRLAQCGNDTPESVAKHLATLSEVLGMDDMFGWANVIQTVGDIRRGIEAGKPTSIEHGRVSHIVCKEIGELVRGLLDYTTGSNNRDMYIVLNANEAIDKVASLKRVKGSDRDMMIREAVRCLESGACRAAIVMTWCLTFDHVRQWIFSSKTKRLKDFNSVLTTMHRTATKLHDPITTYDDFNEHGERAVLDIAYQAKLFIKQKHQVLVNALTDRNHFAHPNSRGATLESALGYVDNLCVNVLKHPDFAFTIRTKKS